MCFFATGTKIEKIIIEKNFNKMEKWILRVYFTNSLFHDEILNKDFDGYWNQIDPTFFYD